MYGSTMIPASLNLSMYNLVAKGHKAKSVSGNKYANTLIKISNAL